MKGGDLVTVVLKHAANAVGKSRLVHTHVCKFPDTEVEADVVLYRGVRLSTEVFQANDDDRVEHFVTDVGVTWLHGHVPFDSPEALELVRRAELADLQTKGGTS